MPLLVSCVSQMLNALRKIYLHVYRPLRLILDFDSLSSRKKKFFFEITNKPIEPTQLEKALKAVRDGHMTAYKACKLYSINSGTISAHPSGITKSERKGRLPIFTV
jgi:hypothetical protein